MKLMPIHAASNHFAPNLISADEAIGYGRVGYLGSCLVSD